MAPQPQVTLHLESISKRFGSRDVLKNINLHVKNGELVALIGASGGGKTTLLRVIAGLEETSGGTLTFTTLNQQAPRTRVVFQEDRLLPWLNVVNNVTLGLPKTSHPYAYHILESVGLAERTGDWPAQLSGGQRQRVSLARALSHQPHLLLLDEPFGALDALTRGEMQKLLENLWNTHRFTAVLVTHDIEEALQLADRVIVLRDGEIAHEVTVDLPRPRKRSDPHLWELAEELERELHVAEPVPSAPVAVGSTP